MKVDSIWSPEMANAEKRTSAEVAKIVIERLGGTGAVAKLCGIAPASVSGWKDKGISELRTEFLKVRHPEAFVDLEQVSEQPIA